jgi:hypothetical protein
VSRSEVGAVAAVMPEHLIRYAETASETHVDLLQPAAGLNVAEPTVPHSYGFVYRYQ